MEKVEIQITKGLTEETTEEITLLGHILENADDPEEGLTTQITKAVKPYLKNLI